MIIKCDNTFLANTSVKLTDVIFPKFVLISSTISEVNFLYLFFNENLLKVFDCDGSDGLTLENTGKMNIIPIRIKHKYDIVSLFFNLIKYYYCN